MASLDNFHTMNPAPLASHRRGTNMFPYHLSDRHDIVRYGLMGSGGRSDEAGDLASRVPIGPVQPIVDPLLATGRAYPDPSYVERVSDGLSDQYVATRPRTRLQLSGDTAEHKLLVQGTACWRARIQNWLSGGGGQRSVSRINTYSRYHPYLGR